MEKKEGKNDFAVSSIDSPKQTSFLPAFKFQYQWQHQRKNQSQISESFFSLDLSFYCCYYYYYYYYYFKSFKPVYKALPQAPTKLSLSPFTWICRRSWTHPNKVTIPSHLIPFCLIGIFCGVLGDLHFWKCLSLGLWVREFCCSWIVEKKKTAMKMGFDGFLFLSIDVLVSGHDLDWSALFFCLCCIVHCTFNCPVYVYDLVFFIQAITFSQYFRISITVYLAILAPILQSMNAYAQVPLITRFDLFTPFQEVKSSLHLLPFPKKIALNNF